MDSKSTLIGGSNILANVGSFLNLVQHRFASHCCETLFLKAAPIVTSELIAPPEAEGQVGVGEVYVSMENLFLYACNEFEGNLGYLMTDQFASHPIRVLLIVLSGMPLSTSSSKSLLQSKKKENVTVSGNTATAKEMETQTRSVPDAFQSTINGMISGMIHGLNTTNLRALANHPISNPILQLLLEIELGQFGKHNAKIEDSLFRKLLPDDPLTKDTESAAFVNSLIYDTIGSRLLETVVVHAPGKTFKALYKCSFGEQLGTLAKNETAAFVVTRIIERLNKDDLQVAVDHILPQIATLIERSRTTVIKTLIDRCRVRQLDLQPISGALERAHGTDSGITDDWLTKMLKFEETSKDDMAEDRKNRLQNQDSSRVHASLLAQCMLETPGPLRQLITESILSTDTPVIIRIAKDRTASRVIQSALVCLDDDTKFRRVFVPGLYSHIKYLATDPVASHVVDSLWGATTRLTFMRERIARELAEHETAVRESIPGKAVWRNWKMDLYKRRRKDWSSEVKGHGASVKSSIELARERFAAGKAGNHRKRFRAKPQTNSNVNSIPLNAPTIQGEA